MLVVGFLAIGGCGYWWAISYDRQANPSLWGDMRPEKSTEIENIIVSYAAANNFRVIIDRHLENEKQNNLFSIYLTKPSVRISVSNLPAGCILNVGFYRRVEKEENQQPLAAVNDLVDELSKALAAGGIKLTGDPMPLDLHYRSVCKME